ncbi:phage tail protein [Undibacterium sp. MH2W]|uniref:phage tail protein n=1 Tax=Undibacterium sp. MH2W TaxID=3413044 RepID=UPI003BF1D342
MDTFNWQPFAGSTSLAPKYRTLNAQFGDGYSQVAADGINNVVNSAQLTFRGRSADMLPILSFLNAKAGVVSFYWTPPLGVQGTYRCKDVQPKQEEGDVYSISVTFQQVFNLS